MFDVQTKSKAITVTGMSLHTSKVANLAYEIYTKPGSFQDGLNDQSVWILLASGNVTGAGYGVGTHIPSEHFLTSTRSSRVIPPHATQGFYVTFTTTDISYDTTSLNVGDSMMSDDNIDVLVGVSIPEYPFGSSFYEKRLWRGEIEYATHSTCEPSTSPSLSPTISTSFSPSSTVSASPTGQPSTASPTWGCSDESKLETTSDGEIAAYGSMFEVYAVPREDQQPLVIKTFDLLIEKPRVTVRVLVYTKPGTLVGHELDGSAWTLI
eukprot:9929464-Ditylum_brightwellii.AAC.1